MAHQAPNPFYSQRLQQKQMAQQAAMSMSAMGQNHANMYPNHAANMSHFYNMRPPVRPVMPEENPKVKFKPLPFFDKRFELIRPTVLRPTSSNTHSQENTFTIKLTNMQATDLSENRETIDNKTDFFHQVQLRIVALNELGEQDDHYPPNLSIKVNQRPVQLPNPIPSRVQNKEPVRPSRPLNITALIKVSPFNMNTITVNWTQDFVKNEFFVISVNIVKKLYSDDLLARLRSKGVKPVEYTTNIIREKLNETDLEIANDTLQVNLACPLSRRRMTIPCRASTCTHLQCFDALTYLQMNEKKQTWVCPVCNQSCQYGNLFIDGYFLNVLESFKGGNDIILRKDGSWSPYETPKEVPAATKSSCSDFGDLSIVCLDDDDDNEPAPSSVIKSSADLQHQQPKPELIMPPLPPCEPEIVTLD